MNTELLKESVRRELPALLRSDASLRDYILDLARKEFPRREETEDRFYQILDEMRRDREEQSRKWDEQSRQFDANQEEQRCKWDEQDRKWADSVKQFAEVHREIMDKASKVDIFQEEQNRKWADSVKQFAEVHREIMDKASKVDIFQEEQNRKWADSVKQFAEVHREIMDKTSKVDIFQEEQNRKWADSVKQFAEVHQEIMEQNRKHDRTIGALGSRWGLQSEKAFRDALAAILEQSFGVQVINVNEYDDTGEVFFGRPDQVELDVIIKNGLLIICELKSSIDKAGMYIFERKARFYERRHQRQAKRLIVISPMIDARARKLGEQLGIEMYGDSLDIRE